MDDSTARGAVSVTPSDTDAIEACRALYVGGTGDITMRARGSSADVVFAAVPAGTILPVQVTYVRETGTTATDIVALL